MTQRAWWKESVVYQIYPRSFRDSNGDGIGDLRGIIEKLDYLQLLGVTAVWLSPVFQSPNDDNGYDISDYYAIMPEFGDMADMDELIAELHARGIKLLMDLVVNHTSDEHPWFAASRASKDNPYRDYYIWRPARHGAEPNNWASYFGGSAWQYDEHTGEYYLHLFSRKQPDLNWDNPMLRAEVHNIMRWWLDKGVDGFRLDAINMLSKTPGLPDGAPRTGARYESGEDHYIYGPHFLAYLQEMKREVLAHYDAFTVAETPLVTTEQAIALTNETDGPISMVFQFDHLYLDQDPDSIAPKWSTAPWSVLELKRVMGRWQKALENKGWNSVYLANHDVPRSVSRFGDDKRFWRQSAKLLATLVHTLQGTPYIYQGEEIGMTNVAFETIADYRDVDALNWHRLSMAEPGADEAAIMAAIHAKGRDNARTPMQWDAGPNAGFSAGTPWINVNPNYRQINVAAALADPDSILHYYRKLIALRKQHPVFVYGTYDVLLPGDPEIYAYMRTWRDQRLLVILNFSANTPTFALPEGIAGAQPELLIANYAIEEQEAQLQHLSLRPYEARVYSLA
jgi:oligo-1,6-glucosidase